MRCANVDFSKRFHRARRRKHVLRDDRNIVLFSIISHARYDHVRKTVYTIAVPQWNVPGECKAGYRLSAVRASAAIVGELRHEVAVRE